MRIYQAAEKAAPHHGWHAAPEVREQRVAAECWGESVPDQKHTGTLFTRFVIVLGSIGMVKDFPVCGA